MSVLRIHIHILKRPNAWKVGSARGYQIQIHRSVHGINSYEARHTPTRTLHTDTHHPKKRIVFLGTPDVSAESLQMLASACKKSRDNHKSEKEDNDVNYDIIAVVTQPPAPAGRNLKIQPSPVQLMAESLQILCLSPASAKDPSFLKEFASLKPDLAITVAYGNFLPRQFLEIPVYGTLNIHPSLLPRYRGAAPVQRCLEAGEEVTGVTVAETVLAMDSGPVVYQHQHALLGHEKAPDLLKFLMARGTRLLIDEVLPHYFNTKDKGGEQKGSNDGGSVVIIKPQDHSKACPANKLTAIESQLNFAESSIVPAYAIPRSIATTLHNRVRAFSGWPGTWCFMRVVTDSNDGGDGNGNGGGGEVVRMKIITSMVLSDATTVSGRLTMNNKTIEQKTVSTYDLITRKENPKKELVLQVICGDGSIFGIVELQPPGKKTMNVRSYLNGLRGKRLEWVDTARNPTEFL